jgi:hypothetical protein
VQIIAEREIEWNRIVQLLVDAYILQQLGSHIDVLSWILNLSLGGCREKCGA